MSLLSSTYKINICQSYHIPPIYLCHLFETALSKISHPPQECWAETFKYLKLGASVRRTEKTAGEGRAQRRYVSGRLFLTASLLLGCGERAQICRGKPEEMLVQKRMKRESRQAETEEAILHGKTISFRCLSSVPGKINSD
ncbi:hypothetical protein DdX_19536 [Ditylenchus destructor]|uniref:Uncharacterized protein n=1 Tax=Ditylenchus destructor TaxID=166010 RepID=A0AAD4QXB4_9BILA|nr:hypothetical protein DdX_19536 [Ditylenchus destructor]